MSAAFGLTTQIYNNHLKSGILLVCFPLLLLGMLGGFFALMSVAAQSGAGQGGQALRSTGRRLFRRERRAFCNTANGQYWQRWHGSSSPISSMTRS